MESRVTCFRTGFPYSGRGLSVVGRFSTFPAAETSTHAVLSQKNCRLLGIFRKIPCRNRLSDIQLSECFQDVGNSVVRSFAAVEMVYIRALYPATNFSVSFWIQDAVLGQAWHEKGMTIGRRSKVQKQGVKATVFPPLNR
jgi:hypothetical protein